MAEIKTDYDYVLLHAHTYGISTYQWCKIFERMSQIASNYDDDDELTIVYTTEPAECEIICDALTSIRGTEIYSVDATHTPRAGQLPSHIDILICDQSSCCKYINMAKNIIDINDVGTPIHFTNNVSQTERDTRANRCLREWIHTCLPNDKQSVSDLEVSW